jgi:hypothetical protein
VTDLLSLGHILPLYPLFCSNSFLYFAILAWIFLTSQLSNGPKFTQWPFPFAQGPKSAAWTGQPVLCTPRSAKCQGMSEIVAVVQINCLKMWVCRPDLKFKIASEQHQACGQVLGGREDADLASSRHPAICSWIPCHFLCASTGPLNAAHISPECQCHLVKMTGGKDKLSVYKASGQGWRGRGSNAE